MVDHPCHGPRSDMHSPSPSSDPSEACRHLGCNLSRYANGFCRDHYIECMKARHWDEWPRSPKGDTSHRDEPLSDRSETPWEQS